MRFRLPELLLMRVDKMTMATSVEARVPFLDHEFVGLAMGISQKAKLDGGRPKHLLKRAVRGVIPDDIIDRPKQGFRVPVQEWLSESVRDVHQRQTARLLRPHRLFPLGAGGAPAGPPRRSGVVSAEFRVMAREMD